MADTGKDVKIPRLKSSGVGKTAVQTPASGMKHGDAIINTASFLEFMTVKQLRDSGKVDDAIRKLAQINGATSTAVFDFIEVANSGFQISAYDSSTHQFSAAGSDLANSILASMGTLYDYSTGFADKQSMETLLTTMLLEVVLSGGVGAELVLDKGRLPDRIVPFSYSSITWKANGQGGRYPSQKGSTGAEVDLDIPTVWVSEQHRTAKKAYAGSMMEASLNDVFYFIEFVEDMRRVVRQSGNPRLIIQLDTDKVIQSAPADTQADADALATYLENRRQEVADVINGLQPEEAIITYNIADVDSLSTAGEKTDYKELLNALSGVMATSLKSHPSILGLRIGGSQSLSNTESLIYIKVAASLQKPVAEVMSRALTLATRLYGVDVYVKFKFNTINLRPEDELEAWKVMKQDRILEQLSLGLLTDDEAAMQLGTWPRPPGAKDLSGTMFHSKTTTNAPSPNGDPMGRAMQPDTPKKGGGDSQ